MDDQRFDRLIRSLATGRSRRGVLKGMAGAGISGVLMRLGVNETGAAPAAAAVMCRRNSDCPPDANRCTKEFCDKKPFHRRGVCDSQPRPRGADCPDEGDGPCRANFCNGKGTCIHPKRDDGEFCQFDDQYPGTCVDGECQADAGA